VDIEEVKLEQPAVEESAIETEATGEFTPVGVKATGAADASASEDLGEDEDVIAPSEPEPVIEMTTCARCGVETPAAKCQAARDDQLLCGTCVETSCWSCGADGPDAMRRCLDGTPVLCTICCAKFPGREWMVADAAAEVV